MAFKTISDYNEERYGNMLILRNDGDFADVIFLYQSINDALVADVHYIKSSSYSGYVHCCGKGCPACAKGIRVQNKLFIPLYNITTNEIKFFDRSSRFENVLNNAVFSRFPNPSEFVFRITRHGVPNDVNTTYDITPVGRNTSPELSYSAILAANNITFPNSYNMICRDLSISEMSDLFNSSDDSTTADYSEMPNYQVIPRTAVNIESAITPEMPEIPSVPVSEVDQDVSDMEPLGDDDVKF